MVGIEAKGQVLLVEGIENFVCAHTGLVEARIRSSLLSEQQASGFCLHASRGSREERRSPQLFRAAVDETVRTQGAKTVSAPNVGNSEGQLFIFPRKNENCESVAGSENEILGACAASPDNVQRDNCGQRPCRAQRKSLIAQVVDCMSLCRAAEWQGLHLPDRRQ
jgi:hypothetical protein